MNQRATQPFTRNTLRSKAQTIAELTNLLDTQLLHGEPNSNVLATLNDIDVLVTAFALSLLDNT